MSEWICENYPEMYCKRDGSLHNGFEVVSHPFSWEWYKDNRKRIDVLLNRLQEKGFRSFTANTCGIHVHLSKKAFSTIHLFKFLKLFYEPKNFKFVKLISQRDAGSSRGDCQWGNYPEGQDAKTQQDKVNNKKDCPHKYNRYTAVNLCNGSTIEVRIFRGNLVPLSFHKNIEFLKACYDFTNRSGIAKVTKERLLLYIANRRKTYKNLYAFLENNKQFNTLTKILT